MAKRKRSKKTLAKWIAMIIGLFIGIGVGGLFVNGTFTEVVILNWIPLIVHQVLGWIMIAGSIGSFVLSFFK